MALGGRTRLGPWSTALGALLLALLALLAATVAAEARGPGNSAATITASFSESCRGFAAHSSKDISHVEIHYADGRVVKDEAIDDPDHAIDGGAGDEIAFAIVKSGTTRERFACETAPAPTPPTAILERKAGNHDQQNPAGTWTSTDCHWDIVNNPDATFCTYGDGVGEPSVSFRGTSSTDPDGDLVSWSIDFGDGTTTSGNWSTDPPVEIVHDYGPIGGALTVLLTVTDSAGHSSSDAMLVGLDDDGFD